jgi:type IV secretory pathway VirB2 component (pilin)
MSVQTQEKMQHGRKMHYGRFAAMIATSTVVMFGLMYLNTYAIEHLRWSETRVYMAILMGAVMAVIMLGYMWSMYEDVRLNIAILVGAIIVFAAALFLVRSQATVNDVSYMKAMIPHHSIAIMTSERANIEDARVRELADEIIAAQRREIAEMDWLIADIAVNGLATTPAQAEARPVPDFSAGAGQE